MTDTPAPAEIDDPMTAKLVGMHYQLVGYVCGPGCVKPSPFEGWATFTQIFNARPNECRFAVGRMVPMRVEKGVAALAPEPEGPFVCWDLYDRELTTGKRMAPSGLLMPPPPMWRGPSGDGLIMKASLIYDQT